MSSESFGVEAKAIAGELKTTEVQLQGAGAAASMGGMSVQVNQVNSVEGNLSYGFPNWDSERSQLLARLDTIEAELNEFRPWVEVYERNRGHRGIGDNQPPDEQIDALPLTIDDLEEGHAAVDALRTALNNKEPQWSFIRICGLVLKRLAPRMAATIKWFANKGDIFIDNAIASAGKAFGSLTVKGGIGLLVLSDHQAHISDIVGKIQGWFSAVNLPF
jgi:hypothetical protein